MRYIRPAWARVLAGGMVSLALAACSGGGGGGTNGTGDPSSVGTERSFSVQSIHNGITYSVTVYAPPGYEASSDAKPVIYALDRELQYTQVQNAVLAYQLDAIIVAVSNVSAARRFVDFELPGAEAYFRFLTL